MAYIKEYWDNKESRAEIAKEHTRKMNALYREEIKSTVERTIPYQTTVVPNKKREIPMIISIEDTDTVSAGALYTDEGKVALLNFASYKNPGGMFIEGSRAQEECLCHASYLYNVLSSFPLYYAWNRQNLNKALYLNRALYTPDIRFFEKDGTCFLCDVITCAAPNKSTAQKYQNVSDKENHEAMHSRIKFILDIAASNNVDILVLGAWGCGVFGQDPKEVASIFKELLDATHHCFKRVVFAIPNGNNNNLKVFNDVFAE